MIDAKTAREKVSNYVNSLQAKAKTYCETTVGPRIEEAAEKGERTLYILPSRENISITEVANYLRSLGYDWETISDGEEMLLIDW